MCCRTWPRHPAKKVIFPLLPHRSRGGRGFTPVAGHDGNELAEAPRPSWLLPELYVEQRADPSRGAVGDRRAFSAGPLEIS